MATFKGPSRKYFARFASVRKVHLEVEPFLVTTEFEVGNKKTEVSSVQIKRLNEIASAVIDDFEDAMHNVILDKDKEIDALITKAEKSGDSGQMQQAIAQSEKLAKETIDSIKSTADNLEKLLQEKVKAAFKTDKILKELNTEFKIKVAYNIGKGVIKLASNAAQLGASMGADVSAWIGVAKAVVAIGSEVYEAAKGEDKLKDELFMAIAARQKELNKLWEQLPSENTLLEKFKRWRANTAKDLENSRKRYDEYLGGCIKKIEGMSIKLDKARKQLNVELKKLPQGEGLKKGIPVGKALMDMQTALSNYEKKLNGRRQFADDMAMLTEALGVEVDRNSWLEKMRKHTVEPQDIFSALKDFKSTCQSAAGLIKEVIELIQ